MRSIAKLTAKLSLAVLTVFLASSTVMANTLSQVEVNGQDSGYGIVLKTDDAAQMKKIVSSDNKMVIELKNVEVSPELDTVYNNVANIENVTISPSSKSDIKIVFKGEGISNSKVYFDTAKTTLSPVRTESQSIRLNAPVSSYTPVYNPKNFVMDSESSQTSNEQLNEVLTKMHITRSMLVTAKKYAKAAIKKLQNGEINISIVLMVIIFAIALLIRPVKRTPKVQKPQTLTGILSAKSPMMQREIGLNREMSDNMNLGRASLNTNSVKTGYGMKAYQQSQRNPYMTTASSKISSNGVSGIARRKPLKSSSVAPVKKQTMINKPVSQKMNVPIKTKAPSMINQSKLQKSTPTNTYEASDLDSMKFLESITKIYEKNGRTDLAKGLKDNLKKAQMSAHSL